MSDIDFKLLRDHRPGDEAFYVAGKAPGAWPNGTRVAKVGSDSSDAHRDGATAMIIASHALPHPHNFAYFVFWDDTPEVPCAITGDRLRRVDP